MSKSYRYNIICNIQNSGVPVETYKYTFETPQRIPATGEEMLVGIFESVAKNAYQSKHMSLSVKSLISKVCEVECEKLETPGASRIPPPLKRVKE